VHLLNLKDVLSLVDDIVVELVVACHGGDSGTGKLGQGRKVEAVDDQTRQIDHVDGGHGEARTYSNVSSQVGLHFG
jgi:hypothetical protein